jgi:uncharacterized protein
VSEREQYQPGVPCWVDTMTEDTDAAARFYGALFGWEFAGPGGGGYLVARLRGRDVAGLGSRPAGAPAAWNTYVSVASAEEAARRARDAGGGVVAEPCDASPAGRVAVLADPSGAVVCAWEPRERQGAQLVNEPSAWAMSMLETTEPAAAKAFYADVFGWTAETTDVGGSEMTLLRLPGYVGGEPEQPVPRDVVAVLVATEGRSRWSVGFWIDDADRAAAEATGLGGSVIVAPHDIPGFRNTILADPEGAAFSVSQLVMG